MNIYSLLAFLIFASFLLIFIIVLYFIQNKYFKKLLDKLNKSLKEEIKFSVKPEFLETSMEAKDLIDLAIEIWRINKRLNSPTNRMNENSRKAIENSMQKINKFIDRHDLEVRDYTGQKYNTSLSAVDIVSVEKDKKIKEDIIKETIEPSILLRGQIVRKAKVILLSNNQSI